MAVLLVICVYCIYIALNYQNLSRDELNWPSTQAIVLAQTIEKSPGRSDYGRWVPVWTYSYTIAGKNYVSRSNDVPNSSSMHKFNTKEQALDDVASRPVGAKIVVYYDSNEPQRSVLDRGPSITNGSIVSLVVLVFSTVAIMTIPLLRRKNRGTQS